MDRNYPPKAEKFRSEVRAWLAAHLPLGWGSAEFEMTDSEREAFFADWTAALHEGGWICATWPVEYGGRGLTTIESVVLTEEFARAGAPMRADFFGETLVGPTLLQWGTEEQKQFFLPRILKGETSWCQGFSEPGAGSDLASLSTRARLDDDEWSITGQKVWTTQAQYADYCFLLARTTEGSSGHDGITYLLVPMRQPGIVVRPIEQMDGSGEFNEVFFDDARCPADAVVGEVGKGWTVAMSTLSYERGSSATTSHRRFKKQLDRIVAEAEQNGAINDPLIRQRVAQCWIKCKIMEVNGLRSLSDVLHGTKQAPALGALSKLYWSEFNQELMTLAIDVRGLEGLILTGSDGELFVPGSGRRKSRPGYPVDVTQAAYFMSRADTIWGGSSQIQRNLISERVLRLPREPRPGKRERGCDD